MLKTVVTKIAHNSTIPALAGNSDLRPLQDLITAEKSVLASLQRLSVDFAKASEALRTWGLGEGDDLGDTLTASASVLTHFSSALSHYASLGHRMRDQLKAVRTREEALDDLKRRRKSVVSSAESAEKKLSKMNPEHKNLDQQQETLNRLRNEIRSLDADILTEEASLGDFKRTQTKVMMGLKFGGLLECCEKGIIAGEYGKLIIDEISEETTPPGIPRSIYYGRARTEQLVAEAHHHVSEVVLSTTAPLREYTQDPLASQPGPWTPGDGPTQASASRLPPTPQGPANGRFLDSTPPSIPFSSSAASQRSSLHETGDGLRRRSIDEFGTAVWNNAAVSGSRFNTYPPPRVGTVTDTDTGQTLMLHSRHEGGDSFAASISDALANVGGVDPRDDLAAPPSYAAQMELPPDPDPSVHLESSYRQTGAHASGRHSAYSEESGQFAYLSAANEGSGPQLSRSGAATPVAPGQYMNRGDYDEFQRSSQGQLPPSADTGSSRANSTDYPPPHSVYSDVDGFEEEERVMNAAAAREVGREMEALNYRGDSLPQSMHLTATDEIGSEPAVEFSTAAEPYPLLPPVLPFARRSVSPRPPFEELPASSSVPILKNSYSMMNQTRQNFPYEQSSKVPPLSTHLHNSSSGPPSPRIPKPSLTPLSVSSRVSPEQPNAGGFSPLPKAASSSSLPSGTRTISAAAFKRAVPKREESDTGLGDGRLYPAPSAGAPSGPHPESRPLPTTPQDGNNSNPWNDGTARSQDRYTSGRFVTNLENDWR